MFNSQQHVYFENFLPDTLFQEISEMVESGFFDWYWRPNAVLPDNQYNMFHVLYENKGVEIHKSNHYGLFDSMFTNLLSRFKGKELIRAKLVMYTARPERQFTGYHHDIKGIIGGEKGNPNVNIFIFNFTTCNGGTVIGNSEIKSRANSGVFFSNAHAHQGIIQSDTSRRILLNIAFY